MIVAVGNVCPYELAALCHVPIAGLVYDAFVKHICPEPYVAHVLAVRHVALDELARGKAGVAAHHLV